MGNRTIKLDNLCIEVTQRCNLTCQHCMRGSSRNVKIVKKHIEQLLECVTYIDCLTLTGGEPTLNLQGIADTLDIVEKNGIEVRCFYMATNGVISKVNLTKLQQLIVRMHRMATEWEYDRVTIHLSNSIYHYEQMAERWLYDAIKRTVDTLDAYKGFGMKYDKTFGTFGGKFEGITFYKSAMKNMGRAMVNYKAIQPIDFDPAMELNISDIDEDSVTVEDTVYLNANGLVLADCDLSYVDQKKLALCDAESFSGYVASLTDC